MPDRIIFHVDVNSAFLSWEAVKRLREGEKQDLRLIPSAVGGDPKKRHGIITASSIPAKKFGVRAGMAVTEALRICPNLQLVPGNYGLYSEYSQKFIAICREYSEMLEQFSVDECFIDVTKLLRPDDEAGAVLLADELRDRIRRETGFTVNIGVSENKLLAKMASDFRKPDQTHTLWRSEIPSKMWGLPIKDLLFVGTATVRKLSLLGIHKIGDLALFPLDVLIRHFGEKSGQALHDSANGRDDSPVISDYGEAKSYGNSMTIPFDVNDAETALRYFMKMTEEAGRRMRKDGKRCNIITVSYKNTDFVTFSKQKKLSFYVADDHTIFETVKPLFTELWNGDPIRLVGVSLSGIHGGENEQLELFGTEERKKNERLSQMVDEIKSRYGDESIKRTDELLGEER